jgi:DNA mismatch repair protein MutS2
MPTAGTEPLDGSALRVVATWLEAGRFTAEAWRDAEVAGRHPGLAARVRELPQLAELERALDHALDPGRRGARRRLTRARACARRGAVRASARSSASSRSGRAASATGTYVTRHGDRFVALVPAAGFPRRLGIVHDVSSSGQSLFVEPLDACESNNRLLEQRSVAIEEERRILRELGDLVRERTPELAQLADGLVHLDTLIARARWARERGAVAIAPAGDQLVLDQARHPLLVDALGAEHVVPLDLRLGDDARLLLVSGPNMGGKTVVLKTVGLACALAHAAFPVVAREGSRLPELDTIVVDLGDEQSLTQGLSTFAAHLRTLGAMAKAAGPRTLVLCDEIGSGTDPEEGAPLAQALVEHFVAKRCWGVLTTHLGSLKRAAGSIPGVANAAMEFDDQGLGPRFRLIVGIPGRAARSRWRSGSASTRRCWRVRAS